ncbi:MAG TPA: hypothetical protein VFC99_02780 [Acidimicrobiia bacterium]|nr:hypothetical protein [Acidimicrobiia bacterium]
MDGIQAVQARIAEIQQAFTPPPAVTSSAASAGTDFASALADASGTASGGTSSFAPSLDRAQWTTDLLKQLGVPVTSENIRALAAWAQAEGTKAAYNPLATTQSMPGATSFNGVGVRNYASYADGILATAQTLTNGRYSNILAALRAGNSAVDVARAVASSPWGTGQGVLRVLGAS